MKNTPHIKPDGAEIAETILLPGDPLRAKFIADTYLDGAVHYINVHSVAGTQHFTFAMSTNQDPCTDNNIRMALKHATNRQEPVDKILFGYGTVGNDHPIGQGQRFFNSELAQTPSDPDKAKWYLEQVRTELDEDKRREMYRELQAILNQDGGAVIPMFANYVFATTDKVGTPEVFACNFDQDGGCWLERPAHDRERSPPH